MGKEQVSFIWRSTQALRDRKSSFKLVSITWSLLSVIKRINGLKSNGGLTYLRALTEIFFFFFKSELIKTVGNHFDRMTIVNFSYNEVSCSGQTYHVTRVIDSLNYLIVGNLIASLKLSEHRSPKFRSGKCYQKNFDLREN